MRIWAIFLSSLPLAFAAAPSWAVPEGSMPTPSTQSALPDADQARLSYNIALSMVEAADASLAKAAAASDDSSLRSAEQSAQASYAEARDGFQKAAELDPNMPGAWNMIGYTERKLGNHDLALEAYGRALALRPNFAEALEYRGEAYLGLNRIEDAQQSYLDLFVTNRELSDKFLNSVKEWIEARRKEPAGVSAATIDKLDAWVQERSRIATQTAALTREGAAADWK